MAHGLSGVGFIESLGITYPAVKRSWTDEQVLADIQTRARNGQSLRHNAVKREQNPLLVQARKRFESWAAACESAGVRRGEDRP